VAGGDLILRGKGGNSVGWVLQKEKENVRGNVGSKFLGEETFVKVRITDRQRRGNGGKGEFIEGVE